MPGVLLLAFANWKFAPAVVDWNLVRLTQEFDVAPVPSRCNLGLLSPPTALAVLVP